MVSAGGIFNQTPKLSNSLVPLSPPQWYSLHGEACLKTPLCSVGEAGLLEAGMCPVTVSLGLPPLRKRVWVQSHDGRLNQGDRQEQGEGQRRVI